MEKAGKGRGKGQASIQFRAKSHSGGKLSQLRITRIMSSRQCEIGVKMDKQMSSTEQSSEIDLHIYGQLIFNNGTKAIQLKVIVFLTNYTEIIGCWYAAKINK